MTDPTNAYFPPQYPGAGAVPGAYPQSAGVVSDIPCRKCGYNLRGLAMTGRCPECGTPVGVSVQGDLLRFSDPTWLETLRSGINLILAGIVVSVFMIVIAGGAGAAGYNPNQMAMPIGLLGLIVGLLFAVGAWKLTTPDPSGIGEDKYGTSRKLIRIALLVGLANNAINMIQAGSRFTREVSVGLQVLGAIAAIIGLIGQIAQLQYLSKLALRIPDDKLSNRAKFLMWAIGISYGCVIVFGLLAALVLVGVARSGRVASGGAGGALGRGCFAGIAVICLLVFGIMYLLMLEKFGKRFKEQAEYARQIWAAQAQPPRAAP